MERSTTFHRWIATLAPLLLLALFGRDARAAEASATAGKVVSIDGKVLIRQDDGQSAAVDLKPGDQVKEGDVINTSSNGKVKLLLEDKTILDLGPSALFKVQKFKSNS